MNSRLGVGIAFLFVFPLLGECASATKVFNVLQYGAIANNKTDNAAVKKTCYFDQCFTNPEAFMKAWIDSCKWNGRSSVLISVGTYYLGSIIFKGPCNGEKEFVIHGVLRSPNTPNSFFIDHWITFRNINTLKIYGGGTLDGQGASAWPYNTCKTGFCKPLPVSLRFDFVNDSDISYVKSINSKNFHFNLFTCHRINIHHVTITAPEDSPNTDGIHIANSGNVKIDETVIGTGDDCISIGPGSREIHIFNTSCGPGHGISVGSLGRSNSKEDVSSVSVINCSFKGTLNGVQIKTWPESNAAGGSASNFTYENISMENVKHPIFINQKYCPSNLCNPQGSSKIVIRNITFKKIWGTSTTKEAVKLECSETNPCQNISLEEINLIGPGGFQTSSCSNVHGKFLGQQKPPSCLRG